MVGFSHHQVGIRNQRVKIVVLTDYSSPKKNVALRDQFANRLLSSVQKLPIPCVANSFQFIFVENFGVALELDQCCDVSM